MDETTELELLRAILSAAPLVVYAKDSRGRFVLSNPRHAGCLALADGDIVGKTDTELFGDQATAIEAASRAVMATGESATDEYPLSLPEGERVFHEAIFRLTGADGRVIGVAGIATDITRRTELEAEVRAQNARLEATLAELKATQELALQQQKLASLGSLVSGLCHEVNTPLAVASLSISLVEEAEEEARRALEGGAVDAALLGRALGRIRESATLALRHVGQTGSLMRGFRDIAMDRDHVELQEVHLGEWVRDGVERLQPICAQAGVRLEPTVTGDRVLRLATSALHQVLTNLVDNACTHAFEDHTGPRRVELHVDATDDALRLDVTDNGRGVPPEDRAKVLEPFYTTRRGRGGTGLGLHITHNLVVGTFEGSIELTEGPSGGTRVRVDLPTGTPALSIPNTAPVGESELRVTLDPDVPRSLWQSYAEDLKVQAARLRASRTAEERAATCHRVAGSLGIYGMHHALGAARAANEDPSSAALAHELARVLDATSAAISDTLAAG